MYLFWGALSLVVAIMCKFEDTPTVTDFDLYLVAAWYFWAKSMEPKPPPS